MEKSEYIEHCRALFENPLMNGTEHITIDEDGEIKQWYDSPDILEKEHGFFGCSGLEDGRLHSLCYECDCGNGTLGEVIIDFPWQDSLVSRSDFAKGGKYYKGPK